MTIAQRINKISPLARAVLVIGAVAALVTGITMAQFNSTATLTDNTLASASAELLVDGSDEDTEPTSSEPGFDFDGLAPGEESDVETLLLRNAGDLDMNVTVYATPSAVVGLADNDKIHFCFTRETAPASSEECFTRSDMLGTFNTLPGNPITAEDPDEDVEYSLVVKVDSDHPGSGFEVDPFDLVFTGTQAEELPE